MQPKTNGAFVDNFIPSEVNFNYTEANSWQYSLFAPHDIEGLTELIGGQQELEKWLDNLFSTSSNLEGRHQVDITGLIGQYAHGNEPSHHMAYLYNYAGNPGKTRAMITKILNEQYSNTPDGLSGNEDCGQMSAWYVLNTLGFYSVTPGTKHYDLSLPLVDSAYIHLENGKKVTLLKQENAQAHISWNGKRLQNLSVECNALVEGGTLIFAGQSNSLPAPRSSVKSSGFHINPYFSGTRRVFTDSLLIDIKSPDHSPIFYRLDSISEWKTYKDQPFYIYESAIVQTKTATKDGESKIVTGNFHKDGNKFSYQLLTPFDNQYNGGNEQALMDGLKSGNNYRTGMYQGFEGKDVEILIDLNQTQVVDSINLSFLQYINAWIFLPNSVVIEYLNAEKEVIATQEEVVCTAAKEEEYNLELKTDVKLDQQQEARYVKVKVKNYGTCPDWHLGAGGKTWIFMDEIEIFTK